MASSKYKNYRVASFAAVNTGEIVGCSSHILFKAKYHGAGFVYDNNGSIFNSISARCIRGKGNLGGFYYRNNGTIKNCGWIGKLADKDQKNAQRYRDEDLCIDPSTKTPEIYANLALGSSWRNDGEDRLEPDFKANHVDLDYLEYTEISCKDDLLALIEAVNDGDRKAAAGQYILTKNLNLHGAKLEPLGSSESTPFTGVFNGNGHTISNFTIRGKGREVAGFFGVTRGAKVANLTIDCLHKGTGSGVSGGMVGNCVGGFFENCVVHSNVTPGLCAGGFAGKNSGRLVNCLVTGKLHFLFPLWLLFLLLGLPLLLLLLLFTWSALRDRPGTHVDDPYVQEYIDPNQVPVVNTNPVAPPPAGTNRISFEMNQKVFVGVGTQVGYLGYVNPARATMDVVIRICVSDSELIKGGHDLLAIGVRTAEELSDPNYNPDTAMTELYRSGRLQIGYGLDNCKLSLFPNGSGLNLGSY